MPTSTEAPSFSPALFAFLRELAANNDREWFLANKPRYEAVAKEPALAFIEDAGYLLPGISPHLVADSRSLFRIHRDTRFSKDKTPYKTHIGIFFKHAEAKNVRAPGLYLHLEPGNVFVGAGVPHPESASLKRIRDAIVARPAQWREASDLDGWKLIGDSLKRPPAGYDPGHPLIADLKRKDFLVIQQLSQKAVTSRGFLAAFEARAHEVKPFLAFLARALNAPF